MLNLGRVNDDVQSIQGRGGRGWWGMKRERCFLFETRRGILQHRQVEGDVLDYRISSALNNLGSLFSARDSTGTEPFNRKPVLRYPLP
jgi:hypothetical protein